MIKFFLKIIFVSLIIFFEADCLKIDRVILSTDNNPNYIQFWPIVAKAWRNIVGIKPTLALIADKSVKVDETLGDVIRFEPIPGVSTALYAQCIRLLLPAYFEEEVCILSDIDMIPLSKNYFLDTVKDISDDNFVSYRQWENKAVSKDVIFPMCYNAAKGKIFKEVFKISDVKEIPDIIKSWSLLNYGWNTDERILYKYLCDWKHCRSKFSNLHHKVEKRIDRGGWGYNSNLLKNGYYIDMHCPRPYSKYKNFIDNVLNHVNLDKKNNFVIVVPSYNNEKWCIENLESVFSQIYQNYRLIYINDCSTDRTGELVKDYIRSRHLEYKCKYIENSQRQGALYNFYNAIHSCDDDEIVVNVDGDDKLAHENVLSIVNQTYNRYPEILLTYGQYVKSDGTMGGAYEYPEDVIRRRSFRQVDYRATHLRTYKAFLFKKIKKEDLMYEGKFFDMVPDVALMTPMLEMVGSRFHFIKDVLYVYNISNPLNENKLNVGRLAFLEKVIKSKSVYPKYE